MNTESLILKVPIEDIIPNRFQPRLNFDEVGLKELASSIKEHGIIQPLVLRRLNDKYEIVAGERRYKAAKMAGLTEVPAIISEMDDKKSAEVAIVENVQRRDLSAIEEAKSYKSLLDKGYLTQDELAKKMGLSQSAISNKLRLLTLTEEVQNALMENKISERHARSLIALVDPKDQNEMLEHVILERLTVRELDKRIKELNKNEGIPLINTHANIEEIREKATDIVSPVNNAPIEELAPVIKENSKVPNKFFNFLEEEQANMGITEPETVREISMDNEEVEMLDFDISTVQIDTNEAEEAKVEEPVIEEKVITEEAKPIENQFDKAEIDKLIEDLKNNLANKNYKVKLNQKENAKTYKINIEIEKE